MTRTTGLYIHVPFCSRRCPYCDFYSVSALDLVPRWAEGLALEASRAAGQWPEPFSTVYLGGGSPSLLNRTGLQAVRDALRVFNLTEVSEVTLEANPEDVNEEQIELWAEWGVTRVSLGAQSFNAVVLSEVLSRPHTPDDNRRAAELIKKHGLALSLDLMFGLPGQNVRAWAEDLSAAALLGPDHLSAYCLTLSPGQPLARTIREKLLPPLPPQEETAEMFLVTQPALASEGLRRYEVSNLARPGRESRHNLNYWRRGPYLGLGPAAHSFQGSVRWGNLASLRRWFSALSVNQPPRAFTEELTPEETRLETIMLGLRLAEGLPREQAPDSPKLAAFLAEGRLKEEDGRLKPTETGLLIADRLALELTA